MRTHITEIQGPSPSKREENRLKIAEEDAHYFADQPLPSSKRKTPVKKKPLKPKG